MNTFFLRRFQKEIFLLAAMFYICILAILYFAGKVNAMDSVENEGKLIKTHIVMEGETLWDYAAKYAVYPQYGQYEDYIREVRFTNRLGEKESIHPGMRLFLPYYP